MTHIDTFCHIVGEIVGRSLIITIILAALLLVSGQSVASDSLICSTSKSESQCRFFNDPLYIDGLLESTFDVDQLIWMNPRKALPDYNPQLDGSSDIPESCKQHPDALAQHKYHAILGELKCRHYTRQLTIFKDCFEQNGIRATSLASESDGKKWPGAVAWNRRLRELSPARRCVLLKQALLVASSRISTLKPANPVFGWKGANSILVQEKHFNDGHLRDRARTGWELRYLHFADPKLVPNECKWVREDAEFRWIEAWNLWHERYPKVYYTSWPSRSALGYAVGMCGRCNGAHYVDNVLAVMKSKERGNFSITPKNRQRYQKLESYSETKGAIGPWAGKGSWRFLTGRNQEPNIAQ